ncbi:MAG TPA: four helix bundle protein [Bacteroidia bacterium]|nr:four helix bundle protein [Bacteroidia bacterium]HRD38173.1 four helix bundle protein [Bacteroidia bacterium]
MAGAKSFEELEVWQVSRKLCKDIYEITNQPALSKDFALRDQIRRSAVSILSNISEGFERKGDKQFTYFLGIAKGSAGELRSQLYIALDLNYINELEFEKLSASVTSVSKMIYGLMNYIKERQI